MKIIHCSDIHLGASMTTHLTLEQSQKRKQELLNTFLNLVDYAKKEEISSIIIAGDLLDTDNVNPQTKNVLLDKIINNPTINFYYLCGNHDENSLILQNEELPQNLKTFKNTWTTFSVPNTNIKITGAILGNNNYNLYQSLNLNPDDFNIIVLHGQDIRGNDFQTPDTVNLDLLKNKNIDYLALGHLHSYRQGKLDSRATYAYSGCLEGRGFDECGEKGFILLDIHNNTFNTTFTPFAKRTLHEIKVDITNLYSLQQIQAEIQKNIQNIKKDSLLRIVFVGNYNEHTQKYLHLATLDLQEKYYFVQVKDQTKPQLDLTQYENDISLAGEFIKTVRESDLSKEEQDKIIILGLQALNGEEIEL